MMETKALPLTRQQNFKRNNCVVFWPRLNLEGHQDVFLVPYLLIIYIFLCDSNLSGASIP
jgi:hypothetical protein